MMILAVLVLLAYLWGGQNWAISLLLGGLSYTLPTLLAVYVVHRLKPYPQLAGVSFMVSAGLKITLALILMVSSFLIYPKMHFLSFFVGLLAVSHLVFLFFLKVYRYGR
ncbi:ATP synthase subunit I [Alysiella filiformis]|uniref:ATP synthase I chain n=1 Tax=Alysiella filiformis DSM 16848 TaxID=1120981 RepID=A0A286E4S3_9NEIS|nr:ATP synthase subunit I [Alysiella filiformis]SOD65902.1 ATP synthase I chain [Alysiella filiformis DSM 16848]